tara:strand:+ start:10515 stop:11459 length:945 start_codon:yes stop_codon:yes gene_type:complete
MQINSLTFCVPTYNRGNFLKELINSIISADKRLHNIDFNILICDDGSTDNTKLIVDGLKQNKFSTKIQYFFQQNQGRAISLINLILNTNKDYLMIMDDDDLIPNNFFEELSQINKNLKKFNLEYLTKNKVYGISFLCKDINNNIIGNMFREDYFVSDFFNMLILNKKKGDCGDILNVNILKENLYKKQGKEKRASTGLLHLNLSKKNKFIFINTPLKIKRYLENGISKNILYHKTKSPNYSVEYEKLLLDFNLNYIIKIRCLININRFYLHGAKKVKLSNLNQILLKFFYFISLIIFIIDVIKLRKIKIRNKKK